MAKQDEFEMLQDRMKKNQDEFEKLAAMDEQYQHEKMMLDKETQRLNIDFKTEIPMQHLSPDQKRELEQIRTDLARDLKEVEDTGKTMSSPIRSRGIMV